MADETNTRVRTRRSAGQDSRDDGRRARPRPRSVDRSAATPSRILDCDQYQHDLLLPGWLKDEVDQPASWRGGCHLGLTCRGQPSSVVVPPEDASVRPRQGLSSDTSQSPARCRRRSAPIPCTRATVRSRAARPQASGRYGHRAAGDRPAPPRCGPAVPDDLVVPIRVRRRMEGHPRAGGADRQAPRAGGGPLGHPDAAALPVGEVLRQDDRVTTWSRRSASSDATATPGKRRRSWPSPEDPRPPGPPRRGDGGSRAGPRGSRRGVGRGVRPGDRPR